jgi:hypothetical protein
VVVAEEPKDDREPEARSVERIQLASPRAMLGELLSETRSVQRFNVSSGPVVADYVTADREEELLRVLDAIGARDVVVGPEGNRVEITFVLDAENSNAAVRTADGTLSTFAGGFWPGVVVASRID